MATDIARLTESPGPLKTRSNDGARYHDGETIITHLNYALQPWGWNWATGEHGLDMEADEVWVVGTLTARIVTDDGETQTVVKTERGWQAVGRKRDGSVMSLGNDYKAADTDALKRAARLLGVGLDAWAKDGQIAQQPTARAAQQPRQQQPSPPQPRNQPAATEIPLADRETLLARYSELLDFAAQLGHRASWAANDPAKLSDVQLQRYADLAGQYIAKHQTPAGEGLAS